VLPSKPENDPQLADIMEMGIHAQQPHGAEFC
jgi:hypothetical protein